MVMNFRNLIAFLLVLPNYCVAAPFISHISWGKVAVEHDGKTIVCKDAKITPQAVIEWDWRKTKTLHHPGIQIKDVEDIINTADVFVLSRGMDLILQTMPETEVYLQRMGKEYYMLQTEQAVKKYNELVAQNKKVAALIHSTC